MNRILIGTTNTITAFFYAGEDLVDADGTVAVSVAAYDGTIIDFGDATRDGLGQYSWPLAALTSPKRVRVTWSGTFSGSTQEVIQEYEAVGAFLFPLSDLRAMDGLGDETTYPTSELAAVRDAVTDLFNNYTCTAFGATWAREIVDGDGSSDLIVHRLPVQEVLSVTVGGVVKVVSASRLSGLINMSSSVKSGNQNTIVEYVYGQDIVPGDVKRAALRLARTWLLGDASAIPERARMLTTEWGTFQITNATEEYPTGLPEVDSVLNRYSYRLPGFA